jgi:hypothetical protein
MKRLSRRDRVLMLLFAFVAEDGDRRFSIGCAGRVGDCQFKTGRCYIHESRGDASGSRVA